MAVMQFGVMQFSGMQIASSKMQRDVMQRDMMQSGFSHCFRYVSELLDHFVFTALLHEFSCDDQQFLVRSMCDGFWLCVRSICSRSVLNACLDTNHLSVHLAIQTGIHFRTSHASICFA